MRSGYERLPVTRDGVSPTRSHTRFLRPRTCFLLLKYLIPTLIVLIFLGLFFYEPHVEFAFYERQWIQEEIEKLAPLSGCFDPARVSPKYNLSTGAFGVKKNQVQAGMPMRMGLDCYDFAGTVQGEFDEMPHGVGGQPLRGNDRIQYHTYWRTDLAPFGPRQEWMLKSFFATQNLESSRLVLWSNGNLGGNPILDDYVKRYPDAFALNVVDIPTLAKGTELEGSSLLTTKDSKAWVDGDLIPLLLLWTYGGVWVDMDSLLTRDLEPLLEHEFVTQWDCY
ncbi:hypothetical protein BDN72DRAFT_796234, partial [Pluteus cervinus]